MTDKLTFIYNADSGYVNALGDSLHKTFSPDTYECSLCALTYGFVKEKKKWKDFLESLDVETEFLHKDETDEEELPVIKLNEEVILSREELDEIEDLDELIGKTKTAIRTNSKK